MTFCEHFKCCLIEARKCAVHIVCFGIWSIYATLAIDKKSNGKQFVHFHVRSFKIFQSYEMNDSYRRHNQHLSKWKKENICVRPRCSSNVCCLWKQVFTDTDHKLARLMTFQLNSRENCDGPTQFVIKFIRSMRKEIRRFGDIKLMLFIEYYLNLLKLYKTGGPNEYIEHLKNISSWEWNEMEWTEVAKHGSDHLNVALIKFQFI